MEDKLFNAISGIATSIWDLVFVTDLGHRLHWAYVIFFLAIGSFIFIRRRPGKNLLSFLLPTDVYTNRSFHVDIKIYLINGLLGGLFNFGALLLSVAVVARSINWVLTSLFSFEKLQFEPTTISTIVFSILFVLLFDLGLFIAHYLNHKIPLMWNIHKVHHSAEVLTPVTAFRFHPIDLVFTGAILALTVGPLVGIYQFLFSGNLFEGNPTAYGVTLLLFLINANFRHSHIQIHYSPSLSKLLVSPVMHNLHHSTNPAHFDKNMGFMFSFWDRIAKTYYLPKSNTKFGFGIGNGEEKQYSKLMACYFLPLKNNYILLKQSFRK